MQLVRLGLSQVEPRPWVSPTGIPAQGKASRGPGLCKGRTDAPVWEEGSQPSEGSLCLQPCPTRKANLGAQPEPLDVRQLQPKATLQNLLLSHKEKCPLSPRAALSGGMGPAAGGSTIPFWR